MGGSRRSFSSFTSETRISSEFNTTSQDEVASLRAECRDLSAQAQRAVEMNVELTSLRNQVPEMHYYKTQLSLRRP